MYNHLPGDLKTIVLVVFIFSVLQCKAQNTFFRTYGSTNKEEGKSLAVCSDGGFIIGADITLIPPAPDSSNVLLVRTNSDGDTLWTRIINSGENDFCVKVIETSDLGFAVLANRVNSSNDSRIMLIKLNASGVIQWNRTFLYTGLTSYSFIEKIQGGYLICGAKTYSDGLLINTNALGDTLWTKYYNAFPSLSFHQPFHDVKQLADSTFVILGAHYNINIFEPRMLRIDSSGNILYEKYYSANLDDGIILSFAHMQESNGFAFAGNSRTNDWNRFIIKVDSLFNIEWQQKYSLSTVNVISSIVQTQDSGFVFMAGPNSSTSAHCLMVKTNSSGAVSWAKEFQYASFRTPVGEYEKNMGQKNLVLTADNGIAFCGFFLDTISTNNKDLVLVKTNANGNMPCDGISANVLNSAITYSPFNLTYNITWGMLLTTSTLTVQGGIQTSNLCFSTSVNDNYFEQEDDLIIFPNPAISELIIENGELKIMLVEIYDVMGKQCLKSDGPQQAINVSSLTTGIYFVTVTDENGNRTSKKFVKM